jgi:hypothetical protein
MIRITASAVVMGLALVLAAPAPSASAAPASVSAWTNNDRAFVRAVRAESPAFKRIPARDIIKSAKLACEVLDTGVYDVFDLIDTAMDAGFTQKQAITLIAGSVVFYCPEHSDYV